MAVSLSDVPEIASGAPGTNGRIHVYDLIRGVAILGILLANIPYFAGPGFGDSGAAVLGRSGEDLTVASWTLALVAGKPRTILAILFGVGMWLQFEKRTRAGERWPGRYVRRMALLCVLGLAHWVLIWPGDILLTYGLAGIGTCWWVGKSDRFQRVLVWIAGVLAAAIALGGLSLALLGEKESDPTTPSPVTQQMELAAFGGGSYPDQLKLRALILADSGPETLVFLPFLAGLYLLGAQLGKYKVLERPSDVPRVRNSMLVVGFGIGVPLNVLCGLLLNRKNEAYAVGPVELLFGPLLGVGFVMVLAMWAANGRAPRIQGALAKVGRVALSCYVLQSIVGTAIFYSWGLGLFGKLSRLEMLAVVPVIWLADLAFANLWLKKFELGPLEWVWRSMAQGKRLRMASSS